MMLRHLDPSTRSTDDRGGSTRGKDDRPSRSSGIELWPHLFPVTLPTGEEAVIALMDTQGAADEAPRSQAVQFLATLLSSLQIFNVMDDLSDDVLEQLRQSIEFGQALSKSTDAPAFQKLMLITKYVELFSSEEPPKPEDVVYATIACLYPAVQAAKEQYVEAMASVFREDQLALNDDELMR
ncbi:Atlastin-3 [Amphibalanus amphitrite]|uniref:Atlastin-3 n=1 Tax=Amphibalanus amphitrite TaxID=1232801 RepID=A0A6A4WBJ8_AMPAM|nr:Atlastin-3 [Amphibalanus amphitrite]